MRFSILLALPPMAMAIIAAGPPTPRPAPPADDSAPQPVSVALRSGPSRDAAQKWLLKAYADATGTDMVAPAWDGSLDGLKKLADDHKVDLSLVDGPTLAAGCHGQMLVKLDWSSLGRDRFLPQAASDCGAGAYISATVLAWDRDKLQASPGWADFWDIAKHPGRRGLKKCARGNLEIALLADGVSVGDIYRTLRSSDGVDRAFRKLDQLKPYIEWWDQPTQPAQALASAKVLLTSAPAAALPMGSKSHIGLQWIGSLGEVASWAIVRGATHPRGALAAIGVATDPARQAIFAKATNLGPSTRPGLALLPADQRAQDPALPANIQAGLPIDEGFWLDNGDKLEARFAAWLAK
jgi:putative spermidine/putrescine transport system substrate-binding protein